VTHATQPIIANKKNKKQHPEHYYLYNGKSKDRQIQIPVFLYHTLDIGSLAKGEPKSARLQWFNFHRLLVEHSRDRH